jgi:hypothetical protein
MARELASRPPFTLTALGVVLFALLAVPIPGAVGDAPGDTKPRIHWLRFNEVPGHDHCSGACRTLEVSTYRSPEKVLVAGYGVTARLHLPPGESFRWFVGPKHYASHILLGRIHRHLKDGPRM